MTSLLSAPQISLEQLYAAETAVTAAGGGRVMRLNRDHRDPLRWSATVVSDDGVLSEVELDAHLGTATVRRMQAVEVRRAA